MMKVTFKQPGGIDVHAGMTFTEVIAYLKARGDRWFGPSSVTLEVPGNWKELLDNLPNQENA